MNRFQSLTTPEVHSYWRMMAHCQDAKDSVTRLLSHDDTIDGRVKDVILMVAADEVGLTVVKLANAGLPYDVFAIADDVIIRVARQYGVEEIQEIRELIERHPIDPADVDHFVMLADSGKITDPVFRHRLATWNTYRQCATDIVRWLSLPYQHLFRGLACEGF